VAKRKTTDPSIGRPRKYAEADPSGRTGATLNIRIDPKLREMIDAYRVHFSKQHHFEIGITNVVEKALRELFEREKLDDENHSEQK
jgi:hypothetical protein